MGSTWEMKVIEAFDKLGGKAHLKEVYAYIEKHADRNLPKSYQAIIRRTIETLSKDSMVYNGKDNVFCSSEGKGKGVWEFSAEYLRNR
ncbi:hypothetical protein NHG25_03905 [Aerococcaceae bacterium NML191292]|nr:hypothetical protein [Aerococcaceae bacterium NML191292]MCW6662152.1 hypothetical protein [Aerococcaceae bacterium NML201209]